MIKLFCTFLIRGFSFLWISLILLIGLTGCESGYKFEVEQRSLEPVPGFNGEILVNVGDIKRGKRADVEIVNSRNEVLASNARLLKGETLAFVVDSKTYTLKVTDYEDHSIHPDIAHFKIFGLSQEQIANGRKKSASTASMLPPPTEHRAVQPSPLTLITTVPNNQIGVDIPPVRLDTKNGACGTTQATISERILDCKNKNTTKQVIKLNSSAVINAIPNNWKLVTRTSSENTVWLQTRTGQLWSDRLGGEFDMVSWCRAKGVIKKSSRGDCTPYKGAIAANSPAVAYAQLDPPESWCMEQEKFVTPAKFDEAKGGMRKTATPHSPSIIWSLPTAEEWDIAKTDGAETILPHGEDLMFWTTSTVKHGLATLFFRGLAARGNLSSEEAKNLNKSGPVLNVRCVGRTLP